MSEESINQRALELLHKTVAQHRKSAEHDRKSESESTRSFTEAKNHTSAAHAAAIAAYWSGYIAALNSIERSLK